MNYIEKVTLENFQSHKNSTIEFDNQLNVIVGPSDSGKTAILRAIKWALYNEPSGDYFIREGESECSVTIVFSDSTKIKRYRSRSKNIYYLYDSNNNETKFEGFGTTVPQEIIDKTGIKKILLDNDQSRSINLSDQLEGAFLLSEKGSLRANSIGRLVGVNVIDDSLRETLRDIRNLSSDKRHIDNQVIELEEELKEYDYLENLKQTIDQIEEIKNKITMKQKLQTKLEDILKRISVTRKEKQKVKSYIEKLKGVDIIDSMIKDTTLYISKYNHLSNQNSKLLRVYNDKKNNLNLLSSLKDIKLLEGNLLEITLKLNYQVEINKIKLDLDKNNLEACKFQDIMNKSNDLKELQNSINKIDNKLKYIDIFKKIHTREFEIRNSLTIGKVYLNKLEDLDKVSNFYNIIENNINLSNKLKTISTRYNSNIKDIKNLNSNLVNLKESFKKDLNIYKNLLLKQETCPLCFSNIDNDKIENIINHYN